MKTLIFNTLFILALTALPVLAGDAPASGVWKISGDVSGNVVEATCVIKEEKDKKLSGSCKASDGVESKITGTVKEKKVQWTFDRDFNGTAITLTFNGDLDDKASKMTGKIDVQPFGVEGDFTAEKEEKKPKEEKPKN